MQRFASVSAGAFYGRLLDYMISVIYIYHSAQGGGLVLAFPTRTGPAWPHPSKGTVSILSGVIATSPLITQTKPAAKPVRWIGSKVGLLSPGLTIPAEVKASVRCGFKFYI